MTKPTIHLNGTGKESLLQQTLDAAHAIQAAMDALSNAMPNARDYYPQGPDAIKQAYAEHTARMDMLRQIYDDLFALAEHISDS